MTTEDSLTFERIFDFVIQCYPELEFKDFILLFDGDQARALALGITPPTLAATIIKVDGRTRRIESIRPQGLKRKRKK